MFSANRSSVLRVTSPDRPGTRREPDEGRDGFGSRRAPHYRVAGASGARRGKLERVPVFAYRGYDRGLTPNRTQTAQEVANDVTKQVKQLDRVIIRFAGDSGDGMQLTGDRFTQESAAFGNDLVTLPNFPAEIRAPQGTLPGVSSFQVHFADHDILTAGDAPDVLVAMNPAALKANLADLPKGATIIVDSHDFTGRNLTKAGYDSNPLATIGDANDQLGEFSVFPVDLTGMTVEAVKEFGLSRKDASRAKNMFALGPVSYTHLTLPTNREV